MNFERTERLDVNFSVIQRSKYNEVRLWTRPIRAGMPLLEAPASLPACRWRRRQNDKVRKEPARRDNGDGKRFDLSLAQK